MRPSRLPTLPDARGPSRYCLQARAEGEGAGLVQAESTAKRLGNVARHRTGAHQSMISSSLQSLLRTAHYAHRSQPRAQRTPNVGTDRKSTRLNSSHANISYAV